MLLPAAETRAKAQRPLHCTDGRVGQLRRGLRAYAFGVQAGGNAGGVGGDRLGAVTAFPCGDRADERTAGEELEGEAVRDIARPRARIVLLRGAAGRGSDSAVSTSR